MKRQRMLETVYAASDDVVPRKIERDLIIITVTSGANDIQSELFTLNATGQEIWRRLDGSKSLKDVVTELSAQFNAPAGQIEKDVIYLVEKLHKRRILVEVSGT